MINVNKIYKKKFKEFEKFSECCRYKEGVMFDAPLYAAFDKGGVFARVEDIMESAASLSAAMKLVNKAYSANLHRNCPELAEKLKRAGLKKAVKTVKDKHGEIVKNKRGEDKESVADPIWYVSELLFRDGDSKSKLKRIISYAQKQNGCLSSQNCGELAKKVCELNGLLKCVCGRNAYSFSSKFLHFISQANPPTDNLARKGLAQKVLAQKEKELENYDSYINVFYNVLECIHEKKRFSRCEVKKLDSYLLTVGEENFPCPCRCGNRGIKG